MKKCKSIALVSLLILALFAVSCGQAAKESLPETAENAGTIEETGTAAVDNAAGSEETTADAAKSAAGGDETGQEFQAGDPEEVAEEWKAKYLVKWREARMFEAFILIEKRTAELLAILKSK